jgi:very-short-patch-repair endonuclease
VARCIATGSLLTCASAARAHGLWLLHDPGIVHVQRKDGRLRTERAVVHRRAWVPAAPGSTVASRADVVLHALGCLPELEALVVVESAIQQGLSMDFLSALLTGPRNGRARAVLGLVDKGADSPVETLARELMRRDGLFVEPQVFVHGVGWMDTIVERCVNIELDGKTHTTPESRAKDYARDAKALARGFGTLRLTYADVVHHSDQTLATTRACVARRLALGGLPTY